MVSINIGTVVASLAENKAKQSNKNFILYLQLLCGFSLDCVPEFARMASPDFCHGSLRLVFCKARNHGSTDTTSRFFDALIIINLFIFAFNHPETWAIHRKKIFDT